MAIKKINREKISQETINRKQVVKKMKVMTKIKKNHTFQKLEII